MKSGPRSSLRPGIGIHLRAIRGFTQQQMLNADAQLFVRLAELTHAGVQTTSAGRPLDAAINDSSVMHLLQPLQLA